MSFMDIFRSSTPAPQTVQLVTAPAPEAAPPATPVNPLDQFADVMAPAAPNPLDAPISFNADPAAVMAAAKQADFSGVISQEQMAAVQQGGSAASAALIQVMNAVAQNVYAQSVLANTQVTETALARQSEKFQKQLPSIIKQASITEHISTDDNAFFKHPAVAPSLSLIQHNLALKYPDAAPREIADMAKTYFRSIGAAFSEVKQEAVGTPGKPKGAQDFDFSNFFS